MRRKAHDTPSTDVLTALSDDVLPGLLRAYKTAHPELTLLVISKLYPGQNMSPWHSVEVDLLH